MKVYWDESEQTGGRNGMYVYKHAPIFNEDLKPNFNLLSNEEVKYIKMKGIIYALMFSFPIWFLVVCSVLFLR